jgi:hypothetical protein
MKIRRATQPRSLRDVRLDGFDMFLLNLAEDELSLIQAVDVAPRPALETVRHVLRLARLGLLSLEFESADERLLARGWDESAAQELLDDAHTLRPPPLRPSGARPTLQECEPTTGVRRCLTPAELEGGVVRQLSKTR